MFTVEHAGISTGSGCVMIEDCVKIDLVVT